MHIITTSRLSILISISNWIIDRNLDYKFDLTDRLQTRSYDRFKRRFDSGYIDYRWRDRDQYLYGKGLEFCRIWRSIVPGIAYQPAYWSAADVWNATSAKCPLLHLRWKIDSEIEFAFEIRVRKSNSKSSWCSKYVFENRVRNRLQNRSRVRFHSRTIAPIMHFHNRVYRYTKNVSHISFRNRSRHRVQNRSSIELLNSESAAPHSTHAVLAHVRVPRPLTRTLTLYCGYGCLQKLVGVFLWLRRTGATLSARRIPGWTYSWSYKYRFVWPSLEFVESQPLLHSYRAYSYRLPIEP